MNIVLLGYRGSGKSTLGKKLANELWKDFVDLDDRTRSRFGDATIAEIWAEHGEAAFRQAEAEAVVACLAQDDQVVALGGGTLTTEAGRRAVASADDALRIYLSCSPDVLAKRIAGDQTTAAERPSLTGETDPAEEVVAVLAERDPVYRDAADIVFDVTHCSIDEAVRHLIAKL
ncbi:MAG: shikimate kinase [Phycisphaeraceae bacterium]